MFLGSNRRAAIAVFVSLGASLIGCSSNIQSNTPVGCPRVVIIVPDKFPRNVAAGFVGLTGDRYPVYVYAYPRYVRKVIIAHLEERFPGAIVDSSVPKNSMYDLLMRIKVHQRVDDARMSGSSLVFGWRVWVDIDLVTPEGAVLETLSGDASAQSSLASYDYLLDENSQAAYRLVKSVAGDALGLLKRDLDHEFESPRIHKVL